MLKPIAVGTLLKELETKIKASYDPVESVTITGIIIEVSGKKVVLKAHEKKQSVKAV